MNNLNYEILSDIDNINNIVMESEMNVINSLMNSYEKATLILEQSDDVSQFDIFQESVIMEADGVIEKRGIISSLMNAVGRAISTLVNTNKNKLNNADVKATKHKNDIKVFNGFTSIMNDRIKAETNNFKELVNIANKTLLTINDMNESAVNDVINTFSNCSKSVNDSIIMIDQKIQSSRSNSNDVEYSNSKKFNKDKQDLQKMINDTSTTLNNIYRSYIQQIRTINPDKFTMFNKVCQVIMRTAASLTSLSNKLTFVFGYIDNMNIG